MLFFFLGKTNRWGFAFFLSLGFDHGITFAYLLAHTTTTSVSINKIVHIFLKKSNYVIFDQVFRINY
jgi:hypothetical protein